MDSFSSPAGGWERGEAGRPGGQVSTDDEQRRAVCFSCSQHHAQVQGQEVVPVLRTWQHRIDGWAWFIPSVSSQTSYPTHWLACAGHNCWVSTCCLAGLGRVGLDADIDSRTAVWLAWDVWNWTAAFVVFSSANCPMAPSVGWPAASTAILVMWPLLTDWSSSDRRNCCHVCVSQAHTAVVCVSKAHTALEASLRQPSKQSLASCQPSWWICCPRCHVQPSFPQCFNRKYICTDYSWSSGTPGAILSCHVSLNMSSFICHVR